MGRRRFEHLFVELCLALDRRVPRFALWLALHEMGADPEGLARDDAIRFCDGPLDRFLAERGWPLAERRRRRLIRGVGRYDPARPTPIEVMERLGARP